ncbi:MAG TPA: tetratricopeptide repeat protein, partial [Polyangiaceae bacterium]
MSSPSGLPNQISSQDKSAQIARALSWLKAEQNAAEAPTYTSMLLHESGVILESSGEDAQASQAYRASLSFDPEFREPIERLIALSERHHHHAEVGQLFQQLAAAADNPEERSRAGLEQAFCAVEVDNDANAAIALLREVVSDSPSNAAAWLLLDLLGDRVGDAETREQALEAQLNLTEHSGYRGRLLMEWAALREQAGDINRAFELLDLAVAEAADTTYEALLRKERLAIQALRHAEFRRTLEQRIRLVESAILDAQAGDALGIFVHHRNQTLLGCLEVLASFVYAQSGDTAEAETWLSQAQAHIEDDEILRYVAWIQAEHTEQWDRFVEIGEELAKSAQNRATTDGPAPAAWLWLRIAVARYRQGNIPAARAFVIQGLRANPRMIALRTFEIHLALQSRDGMRLAIALEAASDCLETESEKADWLLAAAGVWALVVRETSGTKAAVAQASIHGLDPAFARQVTRLLARWTGDWQFYDEATRGALDHASVPRERLDLLLELLRLRIANHAHASALDAVTQIAATDVSPILSQVIEATLGNTLRKRLDEGLDTDTSGQSARWTIDWTRLAPLVSSAPMQRAMRLGAATEAIRNRRADEAEALLQALFDEDPSDIVVAAAKVAICIDGSDIAQATAILRRTAECTVENELRAALALEGILLGLRANCLDDVQPLLDLAGLTHPEAVSALSRFALRRVSDADPSLAHRIQEASRPIGAPLRRELEAFGLSVARGDWDCAPPMPVEGTDQVSTLSMTCRLLAAIVNASSVNPDDLPAPLAAAVAALEYFKRSAAADPATRDTAEQRLIGARAWADSDPSLVAQLEWLLSCRAAREANEEADARLSVANHLDDKDAEALRVSAALQRFLIEGAPREMLPSTTPAARLANLEMSLPGCDPRRRATAIEEAGDLLGAASGLPLRVCLGFNQLAAGESGLARTTFTELVEAHPRFIAAWLGLRLIGECADDKALLAQASAALGDLLSDPRAAAAEWERAANLLLDDLNDPIRGRKALERAVALDVSSDSAFTRLFRMVREAQQTDKLLELITLRLPHAESRDEQLMLLWERARGLRSLGDRDGALVALEAVGSLDPNHVGALALAGEIHIARGQYDDAARYLAQLARQKDAPVKQRLMGGLAAADLFDKKLNHPAFAKDILLELHRQGHSTEALRERLATLAVAVSDFRLALELLEGLMANRSAAEGRADAARLAIVICRDHLQSPGLAALAVDRLLTELPADAEALDLVLTGCFEQTITEQWLREAELLLRERVVANPFDTESLEWLAKIIRWFDDARALQICLGALLCQGVGTVEMDVELSALDERIGHVPAIAIDAAMMQSICDPEDTGPLADLFQDFAEVYAEALGPTLSVLGVTRKHRIDPRAGLPLRNEIVAWTGAL